MGHRGNRRGQGAEVGTKPLEDCLEEEADRAQEGPRPLQQEPGRCQSHRTNSHHIPRKGSLSPSLDGQGLTRWVIGSGPWCTEQQCGSHSTATIRKALTVHGDRSSCLWESCDHHQVQTRFCQKGEPCGEQLEFHSSGQQPLQQGTEQRDQDQPAQHTWQPGTRQWKAAASWNPQRTAETMHT